MIRFMIAMLASAGLAVSASAQPVRGYTAVTGTDPISTPATAGSPQIGDQFFTPAGSPGTFVSYTPNTAQDPQIAPGDI